MRPPDRRPPHNRQQSVTFFGAACRYPSGAAVQHIVRLPAMTNDLGFTCSCCGEYHAELPMGFSTMAPDVWSESFAGDSASMLATEQCIIKNEHFFLRGTIKIPVIDNDHAFSWGVWVSLSRDNFARSLDVWETPGREAEPPILAG